MEKREYIHKDNFLVDIQLQTPIPIAMERNTITEQEIVKPYLDKIKEEVVHLHDWAFSREEILRIIDKYMVERSE